MAQHQHALVRYVTLDRCLSKFRMRKDELIDRCSEAVNRVTGDERRLSEKTFFNDIRALREGIVLGREADIVCDQGLYNYGEHGFSLFHAGGEAMEFEAVRQELVRMRNRAEMAWERVSKYNFDDRTMAELRGLLLGDDAFTWMHSAEQESGNVMDVLRKNEEEKVRARVDRVQKGKDASPMELDMLGGEAMYQLRYTPPEGFSPDQLARWFLLNEYSAVTYAEIGWRDRWRNGQERRKVMLVLRKLGL